MFSFYFYSQILKNQIKFLVDAEKETNNRIVVELSQPQTADKYVNSN
jgi:hypothetical protein